MTAGPLSGLTVVACEQAVAAPFATRQLADLGARVIKVERPGSGDFARGYDQTVRGLSSHFVWLNRSKESLTLDLKQPEAIDTMHELLAEADVFIQNFAPGAAARLGLGADDLRDRYPQLITCSISGYGPSGPYRDAKAYDLLIQAEAGLVSITGTELEPAKTGIPTADIAAGMYAFSGILTALYEREHTGVASHIDVNLFDSLIEWMGYPIYYTDHSGSAPVRAGTSHAAIAPYGTFMTGEGVEIVLSVQNEREWAAFCSSVLEDERIATDARFDSVSRRVQHRETLDSMIATTFAELSTAEVEARLTHGGIAHSRVRTVADVLEHPQLVARDRWRVVETSAGPVRAVLPAITIGDHEARMDPVPALGEHTDAILDALRKRDRASQVQGVL